MKKKLFATLLAGSMLLSLAACGGSKPEPTPENKAETLTGEADGFGGAVAVTLTREDGKITQCTIKADAETPTIGGAAVEQLQEQVVAANGYEIDGVSGATVTSKAVKKAVAQALGVTLEETPVVVPTPAPKDDVAIEGGLQMGLAYDAAHGTKCFTEAFAVVQGDVIVAAYIDEFQFVASDAGLECVPNSDDPSGLAGGYAEGKALASKRVVADYYSNNMATKAGSTVRIDDNFDAIQAFVVGKTIAEVEGVANGGNAVDAVAGATLADTAGYLGAIVKAARNAQGNTSVEFKGNASDLALNVTYGAPQGNRSFGVAAALTQGDTIVLCYIDEFQFVSADAGLEGVPNSDVADGFAAGYAAGQMLASKRVVADYYSEMMANYAHATVRIDDGYDAIQNHVNGMTIAEASALAGDANAVDAVAGCTLTSTPGYVSLIVEAAKG